MSTEPDRPEQRGRAKYEKFLLKEYDNIAQAHYNTVDTISTFFKHYLLIVSLPLPILGWALKSAEDATNANANALFKSLGHSVPLGAVPDSRGRVLCAVLLVESSFRCNPLCSHSERHPKVLRRASRRTF